MYRFAKSDEQVYLKYNSTLSDNLLVWITNVFRTICREKLYSKHTESLHQNTKYVTNCDSCIPHKTPKCSESAFIYCISHCQPITKCTQSIEISIVCITHIKVRKGNWIIKVASLPPPFNIPLSSTFYHSVSRVISQGISSRVSANACVQLSVESHAEVQEEQRRVPSALRQHAPL